MSAGRGEGSNVSTPEPTAPFVLVVDDEPSNLAFVARVLTESGYVVVTAIEPREAVGAECAA